MSISLKAWMNSFSSFFRVLTASPMVWKKHHVVGPTKYGKESRISEYSTYPLPIAMSMNGTYILKSPVKRWSTTCPVGPLPVGKQQAAVWHATHAQQRSYLLPHLLPPVQAVEEDTGGGHLLSSLPAHLSTLPHQTSPNSPTPSTPPYPHPSPPRALLLPRQRITL